MGNATLFERVENLEYGMVELNGRIDLFSNELAEMKGKIILLTKITFLLYVPVICTLITLLYK